MRLPGNAMDAFGAKSALVRRFPLHFSASAAIINNR
jgi:hypothetical protein